MSQPLETLPPLVAGPEPPISAATPEPKKSWPALLKEFPFPLKLIGVLMECGFVPATKEAVLLACLSFITGAVIAYPAVAKVTAMIRPEPLDTAAKAAILGGNGRMQWQWAGENWVGEVKLQKDSGGRIAARVDVDKVLKTPDGRFMRLPKMRTITPGSAAFVDGRLEISNVTLDNWEYKTWEPTSKYDHHQSRVSMSLDPTFGMYGQITYTRLDTGIESEGNIALNSRRWVE